MAFRAAIWLLLALGVAAQTRSADPRPDLTQLSLEQLLQIEVTSVARKEQKLSRAPAAVFVIRPQAPPVDLAGRRVLVVDDSEVNRRVLREQLHAIEIRCQACVSGAEALDLLREAREEDDAFEVVITDLMMPRMDGEMLGRAIKEDPLLRDTKLILFSSTSHLRDCKRLREPGFSAWMVKPVRSASLVEALASVLALGVGNRDVREVSL